MDLYIKSGFKLDSISSLGHYGNHLFHECLLFIAPTPGRISGWDRGPFGSTDSDKFGVSEDSGLRPDSDRRTRPSWRGAAVSGSGSRVRARKKSEFRLRLFGFRYKLVRFAKIWSKLSQADLLKEQKLICSIQFIIWYPIYETDLLSCMCNLSEFCIYKFTCTR